MFKRGISDTFVDRLLTADWWKSIAADKDLFFAMRSRSVNVYFQGCSLFEIADVGGKLKTRTHYKYLLKPKLAQPYGEWDAAGALQFEGLRRQDPFITRMGELAALKQAAKPYAGAEKQGVHQLLKANPNIVDVEIALSDDGEDAPDELVKPWRGVADRVDFAGLQAGPQGVRLVFFEAKRYDNAELRAKRDAAPVLGQLRRYEALIARYEAEIRQSYVMVCRNLLALVPGRCSAMVADVAKGAADLMVDRQLRLVVFGYDLDQGRGEVWNQHMAKLSNEIGANRLLCVGDPKDFKRGISSSG